MVYIEIDEDGEWECEKNRLGVVIKRLVRPSAAFLAKQAANVALEAEQKARLQARRDALRKLEDQELAAKL